MEYLRKWNISRAVRRGTAVGLGLIALWCISLIVDFDRLPGSERPDGTGETAYPYAVRLLRSALPMGGEEVLPELLREASPWLMDSPAKISADEGAGMGETAPAQAPPEPPDQDDRLQPELETKQRDDIVEMTARGKQTGMYLWGNGVCAYNRTGMELTAEVLEKSAIPEITKEGPQILIVHTHGSEAFAQTDGQVYEESDPYRTTDCRHNIVRVGEEMASVFRAHGFSVLHDTNLYDYPAYNGCYERSQAAVREWLEEYPNIRIVLDVHRDALVGADGRIYKLVSQEAGEKVAQTMLVVGTDAAGAPHPGWRDNLAFAVSLQQGLTRGYADLARPIVLRQKRYNQELLPGSLLLEVGGHGNTLTEAIAGARLWTDNVCRTLKESK